MIQHKVVNLDEKGNWSDIAEADFGGDTTFVGEEGFDRAMDVRNNLSGDAVVYTETHNDYRIIRRDMSTHCLILGDGEYNRFTAYTYISNGDGFGRSVYGSSKGGYKSFKGASKKVRQYLNW
jgi:hypothetical protein